MQSPDLTGTFQYNCIGKCYGTAPGLDISADVVSICCLFLTDDENITQICWSGAKDNQESADATEGGVMTRVSDYYFLRLDARSLNSGIMYRHLSRPSKRNPISHTKIFFTR